MIVALDAIPLPVQVSIVQASNEDDYTCEHVGAFSSGPHTPTRSDLRLHRVGSAMEVGQWTVTWPHGQAQPVIVVGGADYTAFRMPDRQGKLRKASWTAGDDVPADGSQYGWLNFGEPSRFSPPGYSCTTPPHGREPDA